MIIGRMLESFPTQPVNDQVAVEHVDLTADCFNGELRGCRVRWFVRESIWAVKRDVAATHSSWTLIGDVRDVMIVLCRTING